MLEDNWKALEAFEEARRIYQVSWQLFIGHKCPTSIFHNSGKLMACARLIHNPRFVWFKTCLPYFAGGLTKRSSSVCIPEFLTDIGTVFVDVNLKMIINELCLAAVCGSLCCSPRGHWCDNQSWICRPVVKHGTSSGREVRAAHRP